MPKLHLSKIFEAYKKDFEMYYRWDQRSKNWGEKEEKYKYDHKKELFLENIKEGDEWLFFIWNFGNDELRKDLLRLVEKGEYEICFEEYDWRLNAVKSREG